MDNRIEEIKQALESRQSIVDGNKSREIIRYLLQQNEQQQEEIRNLRQDLNASADTGIKLASIGLDLDREMREVKLDLQQSREDAGKWERKADQLAKDNERLQSEITNLRGLYERERAIAEGAYEKLDDWKRQYDKLEVISMKVAEQLSAREKELEQVKAERELLQLNLETQTGHFNDTTEELEKAYDECDLIEAERDDYRKVLEWYGDRINWSPDKLLDDNVISDGGEMARTILSRYKEKGDNQNEQGETRIDK